MGPGAGEQKSLRMDVLNEEHVTCCCQLLSRLNATTFRLRGKAFLCIKVILVLVFRRETKLSLLEGADCSSAEVAIE